MGKKKSLREILLRHPELFDLIQLLTDGDDLMADEDTDSNQITISRDGKHKKKKCNEVRFVRVDGGYLLQSPSTAPETAAPTDSGKPATP